MLVITNGRVLVDPAMNKEKMGEFIDELTGNYFDMYEVELKFKQKAKPFLMYEIPEDVQGRNLLDAMPPDSRVEYMAIGKEDEVTLPDSRVKTVKHHYSIEELQAIADKMCDILSGITELEIEKKSMAKRLGEQINTLNEDLKKQAQMHRQSFEMKDVRVYVNMNFKERMKYYISVADGTLVHSEEMNEKDQRTLFDIQGFDPEQENELQGFEIGIPEDQLIDEDMIEQAGVEEGQNENKEETKNEEVDENSEEAVSMEEV